MFLNDIAGSVAKSSIRAGSLLVAVLMSWSVATVGVHDSSGSMSRAYWKNICNITDSNSDSGEEYTPSYPRQKYFVVLNVASIKNTNIQRSESQKFT